MSEKLEELISLLYQDKLTQYGKRLLVENIEKLQKENEELKNKLLDTLEGQNVIKEETPQYIKENYILVEKVKDKIEEKIQEAEKDLQKAIELEKETKAKEDSILWWAAQIRLDEKIKVLKEILKEVKKDGNGDNV